MRYIKLVSLLVIGIQPSHAMRHRQRLPAQSRSVPSFPVRSPIRARSIRHYSDSQSKALKELDRQIKQSQISEREFHEDYIIFEKLVIECIATGKCSANGRCIPQSNCLNSAQAAYLAWKQSEKEAVLYEYARTIFTMENAKKSSK